MEQPTKEVFKNTHIVVVSFSAILLIISVVLLSSNFIQHSDDRYWMLFSIGFTVFIAITPVLWLLSSILKKQDKILERLGSSKKMESALDKLVANSGNAEFLYAEEIIERVKKFIDNPKVHEPFDLFVYRGYHSQAEYKYFKDLSEALQKGVVTNHHRIMTCRNTEELENIFWLLNEFRKYPEILEKTVLHINYTEDSYYMSFISAEGCDESIVSLPNLSLPHNAVNKQQHKYGIYINNPNMSKGLIALFKEFTRNENVKQYDMPKTDEEWALLKIKLTDQLNLIKTLRKEIKRKMETNII